MYTYVPKFGDANVGLELILNSLRLDDPLKSRAFTVLMDQLSGLIIVHRMDLILCVLDVGTLYLETFYEHFLSFF